MILFIKRPSYTAIMCATLERRRSSSGAAGDLTVLPRLPHFVFTACLSERRTKALFMLLKQSTCQRMAFLVTLRRKIKMHPYCFSWTQKNHLKTQPRCVRGLTCTQHIYNIYIHKFGGNFNSLKSIKCYQIQHTQNYLQNLLKK